MTPENLAQLHALTMTNPWTVQFFATLLETPSTFLALPLSPYSKCTATTRSSQDLIGFALGRAVLDEAELLTLVIAPEHQNRGLGRACLAEFEAQATSQGADFAFLEVAASNRLARNLYMSAGWTETGTRPDYYRTEFGRDDAIMMRKSLIPT